MILFPSARPLDFTPTENGNITKVSHSLVNDKNKGGRTLSHDMRRSNAASRRFISRGDRSRETKATNCFHTCKCSSVNMFGRYGVRQSRRYLISKGTSGGTKRMCLYNFELLYMRASRSGCERPKSPISIRSARTSRSDDCGYLNKYEKQCYELSKTKVLLQNVLLRIDVKCQKTHVLVRFLIVVEYKRLSIGVGEAKVAHFNQKSSIVARR